MIVPQKPAQPVATSDWLAVACFADPMAGCFYVGDFSLYAAVLQADRADAAAAAAGRSEQVPARGRDAMKAPQFLIVRGLLPRP